MEGHHGSESSLRAGVLGEGITRAASAVLTLPPCFLLAGRLLLPRHGWSDQGWASLQKLGFETRPEAGKGDGSGQCKGQPAAVATQGTGGGTGTLHFAGFTWDLLSVGHQQ